MKLGITGLAGAGKSTVFEAMYANGGGARVGDRIGVVNVPDPRVDVLSGMYHPKKTTYAKVEYLLPARNNGQEKNDGEGLLRPVRNCDALINVVKNFGGNGFPAPTPLHDLAKMEREMIFADFMLVEKRLERIGEDKKRGKNIDPEDARLLKACLDVLEKNAPLRRTLELASARELRGYQLLTAKPMLVLFNNSDEDDALPELDGRLAGVEGMVIRGRIERELAEMDQEEAAEFLKEFGIAARAMDRVILRSYALLGLISFFTVGEDEVRAWTIHQDTDAVDTAEEIHSDIKKGFIRAEVVSYTDLIAAGSHQEARKKGTVRLEGKTYKVQDGDIINFRFNI
ncbi:MAG TPA: DUF933 domain-containing protein [bacterium]|nr:DUF933 domain-containing protein [bacterium]